MAAFADGPFTPADALQQGLAEQLLWVAEVDGQVAGFLLAGTGDDAWLHILELDVAAPFQRRGLGTALLMTARTAAKARNAPMLSLNTDRHLPWNAPAYARFGFQELPPDHQPEWLQRILVRETMIGLDPARRVAMGLVP